MIQENRLIAEFIELVKIGSESKKEGKLCEIVEQKLIELGAKVFRDNSGKQIGSNGSNIIAKIKGNPNLSTVLLNAHLDTVLPGENITPIVDAEIIKSDGSTILGADDKSGIAIIFEVLRVLTEVRPPSETLPYPPIDIVFTICEEIGLMGVKNLDYSLIDARYGYSLDTGDINVIIQGAPSHNRILLKVYGIESHAGASPERGISAIEIASKAISKLELGKIDTETTANIGKITGGSATNIVAGYTEIEGEVRSHNEEKLEKITSHILQMFKQESEGASKFIDGQVIEARIETKVEREYTKFYIPVESTIIQNVIEAGRKIGIEIETKIGGGGSDANIFNEKGIETLVIGTGMQKVHTKQEFIKIQDIILGAKLLLEIIQRSGNFT
ncbi:MAG: M20/M25/M40 family metallo-hydrolase [Candidatus Stahlbacteria bacterium]|nr:M20/M25/M40 family metallo-hydrolase [Candidatus Stahlbacteria bacterium]